MILSMTGFGRGTAVLNGREITVELRSVNSRYFEYSSRIPRTCSSLDGYRGRRQYGACPQLSAGDAGLV